MLTKGCCWQRKRNGKRKRVCLFPELLAVSVKSCHAWLAAPSQTNAKMMARARARVHSLKAQRVDGKIAFTSGSGL